MLVVNGRVGQHRSVVLNILTRLLHYEPVFCYNCIMVRSRGDSRILAKRGVPSKPLMATYQTRGRSYSGVGKCRGRGPVGLRGTLRSGAAEAVRPGGCGTVGSVVEGRIPGAFWHSGTYVQRGAGVVGRQGGFGPRAAETARGQLGAADCPGRAADCRRCPAWPVGSGSPETAPSRHLQSRLATLKADIEAGRVRLCFGSRRLWRKQNNLADNGYSSHQEWLRDWRDARRTSSSCWAAGRDGGLPALCGYGDRRRDTDVAVAIAGLASHRSMGST